MTIKDSIESYLKEKNIEFTAIKHPVVVTSEEAAAIRDLSPDTGAKALMIKVGGDFKLFVLSGSKKIDSKKIKQYFNTKKMRFSTEEELTEHTGLVRGSIPPFGRPILPLDLYVDTSIGITQEIAFNAGSLTDSIIMSAKDYLDSCSPVDIFTFSL